MLQELKAVETKGGVGLLLRKPKSVYEGERCGTLLKIKSFYDAEARFTGYEPGKGKNNGLTGALKCVMASGKNSNPTQGLAYHTNNERTRPKWALSSFVVSKGSRGTAHRGSLASSAKQLIKPNLRMQKFLNIAP